MMINAYFFPFERNLKIKKKIHIVSPVHHFHEDEVDFSLNYEYLIFKKSYIYLLASPSGYKM